MKKSIIGNIKKVIYQSPNGPYIVGLFKVKESSDEDLSDYINKTITITGQINDIDDNLDYVLYGNMVEHYRYGMQYTFDSYEVKEPADTDSLIIYLSSGIFKGIGVKTATKIVERFKENTIEVIKTHPEDLALIPGMNMSKAKLIHEKIVDNSLNQELIIKLNTYGFTVKEAINLINKYKYNISSIVEDDIYQLVEDVSFKKLDEIFLKSHDDDHPYRVCALIKYKISCLVYESGSTLIEKEELFLEMKKSFKNPFTSDDFIVYVNKLLNEKSIVLVDNYITLYDYYLTEKSILRDINRINDIKDSYSKEKIEKCIVNFEKNNGIKFDVEQKNAIIGALKNNFYIITGGPGTGKTTIIKAIVDILMELGKIREDDIALLAPTGRSAKRIAESVLLKAYTIHKYLKWNKETGTFSIDEFNKAKEKVIIIDESSMIDIFLFNALLKGLNLNVKLLLIGDANQLPSIGPGDLLNDLINYNSIKSTCLSKIYRVKDGSYITYLAADIREQKYFDKLDSYDDFRFIESNDNNIISYLKEICYKVKEKNINLDNFQILAPMYKGLNGIDNLNNIIAEIFNPDEEKHKIGETYYRVNDKVIQLVNDADNDIYNGDIGYIRDISYYNKAMFIDIAYSNNVVRYTEKDADKFSLAYAISIHKSQGSEYDNVVVVLAKSFMRMFYNKLVYTAVTRAKSSLIILGSLESFNSSVQTSYSNNRNTYIKTV